MHDTEVNKGRVYVLSDPETFEVRYIGKTVRTLAERLRGHCSETKPGNPKSDR